MFYKKISMGHFKENSKSRNEILILLKKSHLNYYIFFKLYYLITVYCWNIHQLSNGQIHSNKPSFNGIYPFGTTLTFSCDSGYVLDTSMGGSRASTYCLSTGFWSFYPPKCKKQSKNLKIVLLFGFSK